MSSGKLLCVSVFSVNVVVECVDFVVSAAVFRQCSVVRVVSIVGESKRRVPRYSASQFLPQQQKAET